MGPEDGNQIKTITSLFNGSYADWQQHQPAYLLANNSYKNMGGLFVAGKEDERSITDAASQLSNAAQKAGIETVL